MDYLLLRAAQAHVALMDLRTSLVGGRVTVTVDAQVDAVRASSAVYQVRLLLMGPRLTDLADSPAPKPTLTITDVALSPVVRKLRK